MTSEVRFKKDFIFFSSRGDPSICDVKMQCKTLHVCSTTKHVICDTFDCGDLNKCVKSQQVIARPLLYHKAEVLWSLTDMKDRHDVQN